jgi:DNA repair exonuclease SbcCD nuclease subunit
MKVLLVADVHIHAIKKSNERLLDTINVLKWVFETAHNRDIKHVIIAGDLFQDRAKIDIAAYQWTFETFIKYGKGLEIYCLLGNHDILHRLKCDISSVWPLSTLPGVHIIDKPCTLSIGNHDISFLPFTIDPAEDLKKITNTSPFKLLIGHLAVSGAKFGYHTSDVMVEHDGDMTIVDAKVFKDWDQVFLGHYHQCQLVTDNVEYIGSPIELNFGEAFEQKHIISFDVETQEKEYIINDFSPKHYIMNPEEVDEYDLKDSFVRLEVDNLSAAEVVEYRKKILEKNVISLTIHQKPAKKEEDQQIMNDAMAHIYKADEVIENWIKHQKELEDLEDLDRDLLIEWGKKLREKKEKK